MADLVPSFYASHLAWYSNALRRVGQGQPEIMVCNSDPGGGVEFEFAIRWYDLGGKSTMRVEVFSDALAAFVQQPFASMLAGLNALPKNPAPTMIIDYLRVSGFIDRTEYVNPRVTPEKAAHHSGRMLDSSCTSSLVGWYSKKAASRRARCAVLVSIMAAPRVDPPAAPAWRAGSIRCPPQSATRAQPASE
jgi:hypothetical protein